MGTNHSNSSKESETDDQVTMLQQQCQSLQFEIELKNTSLAKLQTSLNQVLLRNEKMTGN